MVTINSVRATSEKGVFVVNVRAEIDGVVDDYDYGLRPNDPHGLAPEIRTLIAEAKKAGQPFAVLPYVEPEPEPEPERVSPFDALRADLTELRNEVRSMKEAK